MESGLTDAKDYIKHCRVKHHHLLFQCPHCEEQTWLAAGQLRAHLPGHDHQYLCLVCDLPQGVNKFKKHQNEHLKTDNKIFCPW